MDTSHSNDAHTVLLLPAARAAWLRLCDICACAGSVLMQRRAGIQPHHRCASNSAVMYVSDQFEPSLMWNALGASLGGTPAADATTRRDTNSSAEATVASTSNGKEGESSDLRR